VAGTSPRPITSDSSEPVPASKLRSLDDADVVGPVGEHTPAERIEPAGGGGHRLGLRQGRQHRGGVLDDRRLGQERKGEPAKVMPPGLEGW
jgi:hypothetical protein